MGFILYVVAFFCSPLYFLIKGRWVAALVNGFFYVLAVGCVVSLIGIIPGVIIWMFCVGHATWDLRAAMTEQAIQRQAEVLAGKMQAGAQKKEGAG